MSDNHTKLIETYQELTRFFVDDEPLTHWPVILSVDFFAKKRGDEKALDLLRELVQHFEEMAVRDE